jgi:hypothetical protein
MTPHPAAPLVAVFTPALAAGAAAATVGLPLLVHLLFRKRYQVVPWAAVRFLLAAERRHRRRIDQWLLLSLRALALLLPLLAMIATSRWAEDLWQAIKPGAIETVNTTPRTHHILVVDASLSMTAKGEDGRTRFEHAVGMAEKLVRDSNPGDGFTLIVLAGSAQPVVPGPSNEPDKVTAELRKLRPTHAPADAAAALREVAGAVARSPRAYPRRQVTVFTDLQRSTWAGTLPKDGAATPDTWPRIASKADLALVDTARLDADNLAVVDLALADPLPLADAPASATVAVRNYGRAERRPVPVELRLGRPKPDSPGEFHWDLPVTGLIDAIPAGGQAAITFPLATPNRPWGRGTHVVHVRLKDPDALDADNNRYLVVEVRDGLNVVLVDGNPTPREPLDRAAEYLDRALAPPRAAPGQTAIRPRTLTPAEFADPGVGGLLGVDCVFLCDVGTIDTDTAAKLEGHLKRGGGVVIGMGPNAAAAAGAYNRLLFQNGKGLLPVKLDRVVGDPDDRFAPGFRLHAAGNGDDTFRQPPLADFQEDSARAGLTAVPFRAYLRLVRPKLDDAGNETGEDEGDGGARRVLVFVPGEGPAGGLAEALARAVRRPDPAATRRADPALLEWPRHRGRVVVYAGTFNQDWTSWPVWRSYVPFCQQLARFAAVSPDRHTTTVGKAVQEFYPPAAAGRVAKVFRPGEKPDDDPPVLPVVLQDEAGEVTFTETSVSGLYRVAVDGFPDRVFAVNVADAGPAGGSESDLKRVEPAELKAVGVPIQVVADPAEVRVGGDAASSSVSSVPKPWGPAVARFAVMAALLVLAAEVVLAWRLGPSRAPGVGTAAGSTRAAERHPVLRLAGTLLALLPLALVGVVLATLLHAESTGNFLGFLPPDWRHHLEAALGIPAAAPGEGTRWRLEGFTGFVRDAITDRRLQVALAAAAVVLTVVLYRLDRRAVGPWRRLVAPAALRVGAFLLLLFVLLGQLQWAFDREGWPEVVIILDTSGSQGTIDDLKDPAVRAKADELCRAAGVKPTEATRLRLAHLLLTHRDANGADWFYRLVKDRQVRVTVYSLDRDLDRVTGLDEESDLADARKDLKQRVAPDGKPPKLGTESRLGEGVQKALARHKGGSLAGIVLATDGVTTAGDDLPKAAREAARAGVPLYLIGTGDPWEAPDLELSDPQIEDVVNRDDRLVFQARLTGRGLPPQPVPVILYEKDEKAGGRLVERARTTLVPGPAGSPAPLTVSHTPTEVGEKVFVLEVPARPEEPNKTNNRIERRVQVTEVRKARVLYVEGYPRYEFRFVKTLLEREATRTGGRTVDLKVILLDAPREWAETDRSALPDFPTRDQLFDGYDVVVLGDFDPKPKEATDPKRVPVPGQVLQDLADFVKVRGGGLLFLAGEHAGPARFADTPLAEVLPVVPTSETPPRPTPEDQPVTDGYRPRLTDTGRRHPLFRFAPDDGESARVWGRLQPLLWYARGYSRKPAAEVLAVHPDRPAEGMGRDARGRENHPLVVQQFVGAGRVLFFGFDETWRWRFRTDEEQFNRFWVQAVRVLARSRPERARLYPDKETAYRRGERMTVTAEFPAEAAAPPGDVRVKLERAPLTNPDGSAGPGVADSLDLTLAKVEGTRRYEAVLPRTPEGEYRFVLTDPVVPGEPPRAEARVLPPPTESERLDLDRPALAAAADVSRGRFYTLATADGFFADLKEPPRVPLNQPAPPVPLWNHPAMFGLVLALFAAEWLLRKRERLL